MLPPFGRHVSPERAFYRVFVGSAAWDAVAPLRGIDKSFLVCPDDPIACQWPVSNKFCLIVEAGCYDNELIKDLAYALLRDGATAAASLHSAYWFSKRQAL